MRRWFGFRVFRILLLLVFGTAGLAQAASSVTLAWDPSPGENIRGYTIYYGFGRGIYNTNIFVGNATNATISDLVPGATYYFAATATDTSGLESEYSNEVSYTVPNVPDLDPFSLTIRLDLTLTSQVVISGKTTRPGARFNILVSPDLEAWDVAATVTTGEDGIFWFTNAAPLPALFYRAQSVP